ncbi:hypothetical protein JGH11_03615 [Dysgonomonas sp. Marseille-P4677]|nr:hypothetical protein [Dysgonomonas sp. Marseille-P4677]
MLDFRLACFINTIAYVILVYLLYLIINKCNKVNPILFFLLHIAIFFFQPAFYDAVIWKTGSANYLWGTLFCFIFIYRYYSYYRMGARSDNLAKSVQIFVLGLIAGWTNENMSVAIIIYVVLCLFLLFLEKKQVPRWAIVGLIGVSIGCILLLTAPGNYIRLEVTKRGLAERGLVGYDLLYLSIRNTMKYLWHYVLPLLFIYLVFLFLYYKSPKNLLVRRQIIISSVLLILTAIIAHLAMIVSPMFHLRSLFGIIILLIASIGLIYANIDYRKIHIKVLNFLMINILFLIFGWTYYKQYNDVSTISSFWHNREDFIKEQKNKGIDTIVFTERSPMEHKYFIYEMSTEPNVWENIEYSRYYGVRWVKAPSKHN